MEVFVTRKSDGEEIKISITLINEVPHTSPVTRHAADIQHHLQENTGGVKKEINSYYKLYLYLY